MQTKLIARLLGLFLLMSLGSTVGSAQQKPKKPMQEMTEEQVLLNATKGTRPPSGPSFYIAPVPGNKMFSVLVTDGGGRSVAGTFSSSQIEIIEAVLQAAKDFAMSEEKAGSGAPVTTRLMDENERGFFVDVTKFGHRSRFYVSLDTITGKITAPAGEIIRDSKKEQSALFLTIISQVQQAKASAVSQ